MISEKFGSVVKKLLQQGYKIHSTALGYYVQDEDLVYVFKLTQEQFTYLQKNIPMLSISLPDHVEYFMLAPTQVEEIIKPVQPKPHAETKIQGKLL
jgi:hypothetical protein